MPNAKRAASEKPKPRKRAKAEAAFGNEQAPLLGLDVYQKDEADLRERALGSPICISVSSASSGIVCPPPGS